MVPDRHRFGRLFVRTARTTRHLSPGGVDGRLDILHNQLVAMTAKKLNTFKKQTDHHSPGAALNPLALLYRVPHYL